MMKLACFDVTIQFAEDKCGKLTLFKNQVLNDLGQKEKDNTSVVGCSKLTMSLVNVSLNFQT